MEVGGVEKGCFRNFLPVPHLRYNSLSYSEFQLLFGFVYLGKVRVFFTQNGTD